MLRPRRSSVGAVVGAEPAAHTQPALRRRGGAPPRARPVVRLRPWIRTAGGHPTVRSGEFVALVGRRIGKSTLLKVLLGAIGPAPVASSSWGAPRRRPRSMARGVRAAETVAVVRGACHRPGDRVRRKAPPARGWRGLTGSDREAVRHAIESVGLGPLADRPLNELSIGQQQRAFIARAFAGEPALLVLDEPIAGVDAESQRRFRTSLVT